MIKLTNKFTRRMARLAINFAGNRIRSGKNVALARVSLGIAASILNVLPFKKLPKRVLDGRLFVEYHGGHPAEAERILLDFTSRREPSLWAVTTYISRVVNAGHSRRLDELINDRRVSRDASILLRSVSLRREGDLDAALLLLRGQFESFAMRRHAARARRSIFHLMQRHESLAEDGMAFMNAEPDDIDFNFAISVAASAEAAQREDIFASATARVLSDLVRVSESRPLARRHLASTVTAMLTVFDIAGAERFLRSPFVAKMKRARRLLAEIVSLKEETEGYHHVIEAAHRDLVARAQNIQWVESGSPIIVVPAAAFRNNPKDYNSFRSEIRFVLGSIVGAIESDNISYSVRSRIRTHGELNYSAPHISYHTVSASGTGLHFKETHAQSSFSFDKLGYAGWSNFSTIPTSQHNLQYIGNDEAEAFFRGEQQRKINENLSKYQQPPINETEPLPKRYIFIALQLAADAVAQLSYFSPFEMIEEVVTVARQNDISIVIKRHPLCNSPQMGRYLERLESEGVAQIVTGSINAIIADSLAVCVVNSGVGAEALLHEKPVYVFGKADYMAACFVCRNPGDFAAQFEQGKTRLTSAELWKFWYILKNEYAIDVRDRDVAAEKIKRRVLHHLQECHVKALPQANLSM